MNYYYDTNITNVNDYFPFGSTMPGRSFNSSEYRYGFIGAENDNEINNVTGGSQDHEFRSYDTRLGRYKSLDPLSKSYPWNSPYAYAENRVIDGIDIEGLEYQRTADGTLYSGPVAIEPLNAKIVAEKGANMSSTDVAAAAVFNTYQSGKYTGQAANPTTQPDFKSSSKFLNPSYISSLKDGLDLGVGAVETVLNQMDKANIDYGTLNSGKGGNFYKGFYGNKSTTMTGNISGSKNFVGKIGGFMTAAELTYGIFKIGLSETEAESTAAKQSFAISSSVAAISYINPLVGLTLNFGLMVNQSEQVAKLKAQDKKSKDAAADPVGSSFQKIESIGPANK